MSEGADETQGTPLPETPDTTPEPEEPTVPEPAETPLTPETAPDGAPQDEAG